LHIFNADGNIWKGGTGADSSDLRIHVTICEILETSPYRKKHYGTVPAAFPDSSVWPEWLSPFLLSSRLPQWFHPSRSLKERKKRLKKQRCGRQRFEANPDPDPASYFDADPDLLRVGIIT
jgi:hypothetical protein